MREYCSLITSWRNCSRVASAGMATISGRGGHDFAHDLVAELDHGLNQLAVVFLDESFFGAGGDQRLDILGGGGFLLGVPLRR